MIYQLPAPLRGNTHIRITMVRRAPGSGMVVHFQPGSLDAEGVFVPDKLIGEVRRSVPKVGVDALKAVAAMAGAPVTAGEQEFRMADLLAHLDGVGWEP